MLKITLLDTSFKFNNSISHPHFPGANDLMLFLNQESLKLEVKFICASHNGHEISLIIFLINWINQGIYGEVYIYLHMKITGYRHVQVACVAADGLVPKELTFTTASTWYLLITDVSMGAWSKRYKCQTTIMSDHHPSLQKCHIGI